MDLHNLMEDAILQYLEEILTEKTDICKCEQCRLDMACYALNRVKPKYVISSRAIIYSQNKNRMDYQENIDVYSLTAEAVDVISKTTRHNFLNNGEEAAGAGLSIDDNAPFYFNFPQIIGRILDSESLLPIENIDVELTFLEGNISVKMFNALWKNPMSVIPKMQGVFTFWPEPIPVKKGNIEKDFKFILKFSKDGYETISKYFEIKLLPENFINRHIKNENVFHLNDIFIIREGFENNI